MKISELVEILLRHNPDDLVVLAKDSEGNGFSPLSSVTPCVYVAETTWMGETFIRELTDDLIEQGWSGDDLYDGDDGVNAVELWPTN
jgi:hypothetical protein